MTTPTEAVKLARDAQSALPLPALWLAWNTSYTGIRFWTSDAAVAEAQAATGLALTGFYSAEQMRAAIDALPASVPSREPDDSKCPECGNQTTTRNDRTENCTCCAWWAPVEDATAQAAPAPAPASVPSGEPDDLLGEAAHAITALLSLIRRNAPELSGKTLGFAEAVAAKIATAPAAPATALAEVAGDVESLAHRIAWRYKKSGDSAHSDTYTFNRATLLQFADALAARTQAPAVAAPEPLTLTDAQIERHGMPASECPPDSEVMLVSSIRRLLGMAAAPTTQEPQHG